MRIGLISDTHGLLRPQALDFLAGGAHILHAGDIGDPAILAVLAWLVKGGFALKAPAASPLSEMLQTLNMKLPSPPLCWPQGWRKEAGMATSVEWHEGYGQMSEAARDFSRALKSVQEELEAVDWYSQRAEATTDPALRSILLHNRNEEIEHAMMMLEYLRRISPVFNEHMRTYLFSTGDITGIEAAAEREPDKDPH